MQINSVASPSVPNDSVTRTSTGPATPTPTQSAQLAEDTVQLSSATASSANSEDTAQIEIGRVYYPPP